MKKQHREGEAEQFYHAIRLIFDQHFLKSLKLRWIERCCCISNL